MQSNKKNMLPLISILTVPLLNILYTVLNSFNGSVYNLGTKFDDRVPFISVFIVPYNLWYPFILSALVYLFFKDRKVFAKTIIATDIGLLCCYIVYLTFQTTVTRPTLYGEDILTKLVSITYALDEPYNCLPSIHVLTSYLIMKGYYKSSIKSIIMKTIIFAVAGTIIISTLFVKQHVIVDIIAAIIVGEMVYFVAGLINEERVALWIKKQYLSWMTKKKLEI